MSVSSFLHVYAGDDFGLYTNPPVFASRGRRSFSVSNGFFSTVAILAEAMMFQSMPRNLNAGEDCLRIFQRVGGATTAFILTARFQSVFLDEFIRRGQASVLPFS